MFIFLLEQFWSIQFHWIEVIVLILVIPSFGYTVKHLYNKIKFRKFLGEYKGRGTTLVYILYKYFDFGKITIYATESTGATWAGKYEIGIDDLSLEGIYNWVNKDKGHSVPDKGKHNIYFSLDGTKVDIKWRRITGLEIYGDSEWWRSDAIYNQKNLLQFIFRS